MVYAHCQHIVWHIIIIMGHGMNRCHSVAWIPHRGWLMYDAVNGIIGWYIMSIMCQPNLYLYHQLDGDDGDGVGIPNEGVNLLPNNIMMELYVQ